MLHLFADYKGRRVVSGELDRDGVFKKTVKLNQKLMVLNSYGIDEENFLELKSLGCEKIQLHEKDTSRVFEIDFNTFKKMAVRRQIGKFGVRYYLPLKYWTLVSYNKSLC